MKEKVDAVTDTYQTDNLVRANRIFDVVLNLNSTLKTNISTTTTTTTASMNRQILSNNIIPESRMRRSMESPKMFA